jgi:hypothetical protein
MERTDSLVSDGAPGALTRQFAWRRNFESGKILSRKYRLSRLSASIAFFNRRGSDAGPTLIFQVVGQSRDDVPAVGLRREAIVPARNLLSKLTAP